MIKINELKILMVYANCMMDNLVPIGLSSLIGSLKSLDVQIKLFDTTFYRTDERSSDDDRVANLQVPNFDYSDTGLSIKEENIYEDFQKLVKSYQPHIIMLSVVELTCRQGLSLLESISDIRPFVVVGGVYAFFAAEELIQNNNVDAVCVGEGEKVVKSFCEKFAEGKNFLDTKSMWFKNNGKILKNELAPLVDINTIPYPDYSKYQKNRFFKPMQGKIFRMLPVEFSRGCPYRCTYCGNHAIERHFKPVGRWYRMKTIDRIMDEIDFYLKTYKTEFFYFISESFLSMKKNLFDEFCDRYSKYKIPFWFNTRPETITEEKIKQLESVNCFRMGIGLEHGSEAFRKKILKRSVSNEKIVEACKIVEKSSISYSINNMIGLPHETRELVFETISLNKQIKPNSVSTFVFTPFKGTDLYDYCLKEGLITEQTKTGDLHRESILQNNTITNEEIKGLLRTFPLYVHYDETMFPLIKKAEKFDDQGNKIFKELGESYIKKHFGS